MRLEARWRWPPRRPGAVATSRAVEDEPWAPSPIEIWLSTHASWPGVRPPSFCWPAASARSERQPGLLEGMHVHEVPDLGASQQGAELFARISSGGSTWIGPTHGLSATS